MSCHVRGKQQKIWNTEYFPEGIVVNIEPNYFYFCSVTEIEINVIKYSFIQTFCFPERNGRYNQLVGISVLGLFHRLTYFDREVPLCLKCREKPEQRRLVILCSTMLTTLISQTSTFTTFQCFVLFAGMIKLLKIT